MILAPPIARRPYLHPGAGATIDLEFKTTEFWRLDTLQTNFLAAMTECTDRRQIRVRYQGPREVADRSPLPHDDAADGFSLMLGCTDPRQVRVHYGSARGHGSAVA